MVLPLPRRWQVVFLVGRWTRDDVTMLGPCRRHMRAGRELVGVKLTRVTALNAASHVAMADLPELGRNQIQRIQKVTGLRTCFIVLSPH